MSSCFISRTANLTFIVPTSPAIYQVIEIAEMTTEAAVAMGTKKRWLVGSFIEL